MRCARTAECNKVFLTVRAFLLGVAAEKALLCNAPYHIPLMGAGALWPCTVAACWFAAALALHLDLFTAMLQTAVWAYILE